MSRRFVLVKSYYGLGGDLCVLLSAWLFARERGRELIVDWSGGRYGSVEDGHLFRRFFADPPFLCPSDVPGLDAMSVSPAEWRGRLLLPPVTYLKDVDLTRSRPDDVPLDCVDDCIVITRDSRELLPRLGDHAELAGALRLQEHIQSQVARQLGRLEPFQHSIGIHFRHGNGEKKVMAPDPRWFRNRINGRLKQTGLAPEQLGLYVATDCAGTLEYFKRYYPNVIDLPKSYRPNGGGALHVGRDDLSPAEKVDLAVEALVDIYTLAGCDSFVGSRGYFSLVVRLLRNDAVTVVYPGARVVGNEDIPAERAAASDPVFGVPIRRMKIPTDGLLVDRSDDAARTLRYYDDAIMSVPADQLRLSDDEQLVVRRSIVARRTY
jgi:Nodulation protein Z (NodZ)